MHFGKVLVAMRDEVAERSGPTQTEMCHVASHSKAVFHQTDHERELIFWTACRKEQTRTYQPIFEWFSLIPRYRLRSAMFRYQMCLASQLMVAVFLVPGDYIFRRYKQ